MPALKKRRLRNTFYLHHAYQLIIVGVLIGYLSFGNKKVNESNDTLLKSKPFNNSINILKAMSEGIGVEIDVNFD